MDFQNTSESVNSGEAVSIERFGKVFSVPGEKYAYNSNVICDNDGSKFHDEVGKVNPELGSNFDSTLHCGQDRSEQSEQNCTKNEQLDDKLNLGVAEHSESKEPDSSLSEGGEATESDSRDNLVLSNDRDSNCKLSDVTDDQIETAVLGHIDIDRKDTKRTRRNSKRKRDSQECCPVCGITVRMPELECHFEKEVKNLSKIPKNLRRTQTEEKSISTTYVQVKSNRENRLSAKVARYAAKDKNEVQCPVCSLKMTGSQAEINKHVLNCINEDEMSDELVVVDDGEDSFGEYEFADQTRVRAISFVPGGYRSLQGNFCKSKTADEDEDLNVDVDDTFAYGKPQEMDVIHTTTDATEVKELEQLRKAVLLDPSVQPHVLESRKWSNKDEEKSKSSEQASGENSLDSNISIKKENTEKKGTAENEESHHVVASLREKIKDLDELNRSVKCLICLEPYAKPVVSTTCWHVHCEECWLMTMGVKKLCPQCNMIVFPSDLRRIYL